MRCRRYNALQSAAVPGILHEIHTFLCFFFSLRLSFFSAFTSRSASARLTSLTPDSMLPLQSAGRLQG